MRLFKNLKCDVCDFFKLIKKINRNFSVKHFENSKKCIQMYKNYTKQSISMKTNILFFSSMKQSKKFEFVVCNLKVSFMQKLKNKLSKLFKNQTTKLQCFVQIMLKNIKNLKIFWNQTILHSNLSFHIRSNKTKWLGDSIKQSYR